MPSRELRRRCADEGGLVRKLLSDVEGLGGIAAVSELLGMGHWRDAIELCLQYGSLVRVRNGWVAVPSTPDAVLRAWRVGGSLACVSAVQHHLGTTITGPLHVMVPGNAARVRSPNDHRRPPAAGEAVIHWDGRGEPAGLAVTLGRALRQTANCRQARTEVSCRQAGLGD